MRARYDLIVRGGTVADGSGNSLFEADVAISDGLIANVGNFDGQGAEEIQAKGLLVTPGFVDIHTHYDGQATWEQRLLPGSWHGVTTAVMGNCGVGFAPVKKGDQKRLIELMEGVEDIPGAVLNEGIRWQWESFGQYLDFLESFGRDMDVCAQLAHGPLRIYVMGERASRLEAATSDDIGAMRVLTRDAVRQGAMGFSTSRTLNHRTATGDPTPGVRASEQELLGIALGLKDAGAGVLQFISDWDTPDLQTEFTLVRNLTRASGRPLSFSLGQRHATPDVWRELLALTNDSVAAGLQIQAQVSPRPIAILLGLQGSLNPFSDYPSYQRIAHLGFDERLAIMRTPEFRARVLAEAPSDETSPIAARLRSFEHMFPLGNPPDYEPSRATSVAAQAARQNRGAAELAYDILVGGDGRNFLFGPITNYAGFNLDVCREMMTSENTLLGLGDGGAHVSIISDASFTTYLLTHWARDRPTGRLPMNWLVKRLAWDNARYIGLHDRGLIKVGMKADLNVIDAQRLALDIPYMASDLPAGGNRLLQKARGYVATIVSGSPTYRDGAPTGALPGTLVRGPQRPRPA